MRKREGNCFKEPGGKRLFGFWYVPYSRAFREMQKEAPLLLEREDDGGEGRVKF